MSRRRGLRTRTQNRRKGSGFPGWLGMVVGVAMGGLAVWLWQADSLPWQGEQAAVQEEAAPVADTPGNGTPPSRAEPPADDEGFEFYELLPDAEVVVPEAEGPRAAPGPPPVDVPGAYVIQAGAFPEFGEADAVKARLALLGVAAEIQKVTVDERTFHRVRVGPIENLNELNRLRTRLRQNRIDFLVIQVSE